MTDTASDPFRLAVSTLADSLFPASSMSGSPSTMQLTCATFAYPRLDSASRSEVARLVTGRDLPNVFVLSTCLRTEVVFAGPPDSLFEHFAGTDAEDFPNPEFRENEEAVHHLFRVAAGLESPVVGEKEILVQYRTAVAHSIANEHLDPQLIRLLQAGIGAGRRVRQVLPPQVHDSMGEIAANLTDQHDHVTIIGAGDMAAAVVRSLMARPAPPSITLLARRPEHVTIAGVNVQPMGELTSALGEATAIVSATSASSKLLAQEHVAVLVEGRSHPLLLVDMALPPDFSPPENPLVSHYDIDDLAFMAGSPSEADDADQLVAQLAITAYRRHRTHHAVGPLIGQMVNDADAIVDAMVAKFGPKLATATDEAILRQAVHTAARSILARPIAHLRQSGPQFDPTLISEYFPTDE